MTQAMFPRPIAHRGLHDRANGIIENNEGINAAAPQSIIRDRDGQRQPGRAHAPARRRRSWSTNRPAMTLIRNVTVKSSAPKKNSVE